MGVLKATMRNPGEGPRARLRTGTQAPICGGVNERRSKDRPFHELRERPKARTDSEQLRSPESAEYARQVPVGVGCGPGGRGSDASRPCPNDISRAVPRTIVRGILNAERVSERAVRCRRDNSWNVARFRMRNRCGTTCDRDAE